ncbi:MAG: rlmB [Gammaproteobacteria bacterium]|jgi:23S rRNA (guanosine2251-2'-O)-methyltransferase|nr:rlmB [Gammaproteobacteria bacterium]
MANLIAGINTIQTLLEHQPERITQLFLVSDRQDQRAQKIISLAKNHGIKIQPVNAHKLDQLLPHVQHQGVAADCKPLPNYGEHDIEKFIVSAAQPFFLILDGVQDPHNLGACIRSADAAGVTAVIIPKDRAASVNPTVKKVASGAAEFVPVITVTNLSRALKKLKDEGVFLVGLAGEATQSLYQTNLKGPIGIILGAEEDGMRRLTREHCDALASLPMHGAVSSLNVSVAAGISLFEVVRQRQNP